MNQQDTVPSPSLLPIHLPPPPSPPSSPLLPPSQHSKHPKEGWQCPDSCRYCWESTGAITATGMPAWGCERVSVVGWICRRVRVGWSHKLSSLFPSFLSPFHPSLLPLSLLLLSLLLLLPLSLPPFLPSGSDVAKPGVWPLCVLHCSA